MAGATEFDQLLNAALAAGVAERTLMRALTYSKNVEGPSLRATRSDVKVCLMLQSRIERIILAVGVRVLQASRLLVAAASRYARPDNRVSHRRRPMSDASLEFDWTGTRRSSTIIESALIVGASGIIGNNLARLLASNGSTVYALARRPPTDIAGVSPVAADLRDPASLRAALGELRPSHVFLTAWLRQTTEAENIVVNGSMVRNVLDVVSAAGSVKHVALVTGLKHYLGPFEAYGKGTLPATPFREEQARSDVENFYYAQEDELFRAAARDGFGWSVHRPHTVIGYAIGNAMNMGVTLAVYATICRETGRPFTFPGSPVQWNGLTDMTDARLLARHLAWAATTAAARDQAFNVVNGDVFRWSWMWNQLADWFGIPAAPFLAGQPLEAQLADAAPLWSKIAGRYNLAEPDLGRLASAWHTDADLGRPIEVVTDMSKSRKLGFLDYQSTNESFFDLFAQLREAKIIS